MIKRSTILVRNCYVISFDTDKDNYNRKGDLFIDMDNFAVVRKVNRSKKDNRILRDITFKRQNDKYYLKKTEDFYISYYAPEVINYRITLYNYLDIKESNLDFINLNVQYSTKITSNFSDEFWENNNFIPLPNWVKKQMK